MSIREPGVMPYEHNCRMQVNPCKLTPRSDSWGRKSAVAGKNAKRAECELKSHEEPIASY